MKPLNLTGHGMTAADFLDVVLRRRPVRLSARATQKMNRSRRVVERILSEGRVVYGVNTGFGKLATERISHSDIARLQVNLLRSHACGVGPPLAEDAVRGMLLLRAHVLAMGHSGVRPVVAEHLLQILNQPLYPRIPRFGSVGASGDLIPLAHLSLLLIGEGEAYFEGARLPATEALKRAGIEAITLKAKEGLSLVNGTQAALSLGLLGLHAAECLADASDLAGAMTLEALMGTPTAFDEKLQELRPHRGQLEVAKNIQALLRESEIRASHITCNRVQDPYSIRCIPQVHGAVRDAIDSAKAVLSTEINSVTDNPIVFPETGEILSGGNFHGHPLALALDVLAIALTHLSVISERRIAQLIAPDCIDLPPFLTRRPGLNSGLMMPQVAAAALASECKRLSHPASVDSIPTSVDQEDYVSMAMGAALKLQEVTTHVGAILAIELFAAAEGVSFHAPLKAGVGVMKGIKKLRTNVRPLDADRSLHADFEKITRMISGGIFSLNRLI
ncbi:MAG: histidine ammonia-lyase [Nitrospiria bacterium]